MPWIKDDGGRSAAGFRGETGDCAVRAIAIATGIAYRDVYDALTDVAKELAGTTRGRNKVRGKTPRQGTDKRVIRETLARLGWRWTPTMSIGSGTTVHLRAEELPPGRLVVSVSKHLCAVIDGVIHDNHDPSRDGTRAVYGYWSRPDAY